MEEKELNLFEEQEPKKKSGKELMLERLSVKHPDLDGEDDEALFGAIGADYDEWEAGAEVNARMKDSLDKMLEVFNASPEAAALYVDLAKGGKSVLEYLIENYGDDFKEALEARDEETIAKLTKAESNYRAKMAKNEELNKEAQANLVTSLDALDEAANEAGISDEDKDKAFEAYANLVDDAIRNKVSKETWLMFIKGINHDKDVAEAADEGEVRGRNTKIVEKLRKPTDTPPVLSGQGASAPKRKFGGILDSLDSEDWYSKASK